MPTCSCATWVSGCGEGAERGGRGKTGGEGEGKRGKGRKTGKREGGRGRRGGGIFGREDGEKGEGEREGLREEGASSFCSPPSSLSPFLPSLIPACDSDAVPDEVFFHSHVLLPSIITPILMSSSTVFVVYGSLKSCQL